MSTPITEAHQAAATEWFMSRPTNVNRQIDNLAQLIADSEAEAVQTAMIREYGNLCATNESLAKERDQLRAEVEDLKARITQDHGIVELMEAELKDLKSAGGPPFIRSAAIRNLRDQVCGLKARAARAEAELAAERARLRDLWCEMALEYRDERISYVSVQITRSVWDELDAAMKEGAK
jgi:hypothetical protein